MPAADLRADLAAKLNQLEVGAAVLERDARRSAAAELGLAVPAPAQRQGWRKARLLSRRLAGTALRAVLGAWAVTARAIRSPRTRAAFRFARGFLTDLLVYAAVALAALIPAVIAILIFATPE